MLTATSSTEEVLKGNAPKFQVGLYGGMMCDFGKAGGATTLASGKAVGLTAKSGAVTLNGVSVTASDGATAGESSIGVLAESGVVLTVMGGTVTAGAGAAGSAGTTGTNCCFSLRRDSLGAIESRTENQPVP